MSFAHTFDRIVWPALAESARVNGVLVGCELMSFDDAASEVIGIARSRGARYLEIDEWDRLEDRILEVILTNAERVSENREHFAKWADENPGKFWKYVWKITEGRPWKREESLS